MLRAGAVLALLVAVAASGCTAHPEPTNLLSWGSWRQDGSAIRILVGVYGQEFQFTGCDCRITVTQGDDVLGTWDVTPVDFALDPELRQRYWVATVPADQVEPCSDQDWGLHFGVHARLPDGRVLAANPMAACSP